jgi:chorismate-pyruvate lyase
MSAFDILNKLTGVELSSLGPVQRILLVTDGTLTEILEAAFLEPVQLVKLSQTLVTSAESDARLEPVAAEKFLRRKILLRGNSGRNYVYAESLIAVERLTPSFRNELLNSDIPLGRLWLEHKLETFKKLQEIDCRADRNLAEFFPSAAQSLFLTRTYCVFSAGRPVMLVTESFPTVYDDKNL